MSYKVSARFMSGDSTMEADTPEEALRIGQGEFGKSASSVAILGPDGRSYSVEQLEQEIAGQQPS
mgnify:FL=1